MPDKHEDTEAKVLIATAKKIGKAAGKIATFAGTKAAPPAAAGKLPKKNKSRLPRRQKKAQRKLGAVTG